MALIDKDYWQVVRKMHEAMDKFLQSLSEARIAGLLHSKMKIDIRLMPVIQAGTATKKSDEKEKSKTKKKTKKKRSRISSKPDKTPPIVNELYNAEDSKTAQKILRKKKKAELVQIAEEYLFLEVGPKDTIEMLKNKIIEATLEARLDAQAISS